VIVVHVSASSGNAGCLTTVATFTTQYNAMLDKLIAGAPRRGMVVGNLPTHIAAAPITSTVPPFIVNPRRSCRSSVRTASRSSSSPTSAAERSASSRPAVRVALGGVQARHRLRHPVRAQDRAAVNQLPDVGSRWPTRTSSRRRGRDHRARANDFNAVIAASAAARNIPWPTSALFDRLQNRREFVGPFSFTSDFITGGFFSLDGFHLSDIGYTLFADEYIKAINADTTRTSRRRRSRSSRRQRRVLPEADLGQPGVRRNAVGHEQRGGGPNPHVRPEVPRTTRFRTRRTEFLFSRFPRRAAERSPFFVWHRAKASLRSPLWRPVLSWPGRLGTLFGKFCYSPGGAGEGSRG